MRQSDKLPCPSFRIESSTKWGLGRDVLQVASANVVFTVCDSIIIGWSSVDDQTVIVHSTRRAVVNR